MSTSAATLPAHTRTTTKPPRFFYPSIGVLFLGLTLLGFQHFYFSGMSYPGRPITPPIRSLVIAHGLAMAGWILIFTLQPMLVAGRNIRAHMMVGRVAAFFAVLVFVLGMMLSVESTRVSATVPGFVLWTLTSRQFMAVPMFTALFFGACAGIAVWKRKRPEIHRPMMMVGTLSALGAAVSRIDFLNNLYVGTGWERALGPFLFPTLLGLILLAVKCALTRKFDRWLAVGMTALLFMAVFTMPIARTPAWEAFAKLLVP